MIRQELIHTRRRSHTWQTILLLLLLFGLMVLVGFGFFGIEGLIWAALLGIITGIISLRIPTRFIMNMYRARPLQAGELTEVQQIVHQLAKRAGLSHLPQVYYLPNRMVNAFATGRIHDAGIAVTYGILTQLNIRELTGVLAHEISHITNHDLRIKSLVNIIGRLTRMFTVFGQILLLISIPMLMTDQLPVPLWAVVLLLVAPVLTNLLVLAISRTREYDADLEAARLTGDPNALADALQKLDLLNNGPGLLRQPPPILSSHPKTQERVKRLRELAPRYTPAILLPGWDWLLQQYPKLGYSRFL
ncbi:MAG: M48 family metalloprotease [Lewinellaceae bacterium]|nr:M48 family metalloprotease [Lewinellaceae bacterium]